MSHMTCTATSHMTCTATSHMTCTAIGHMTCMATSHMTCKATSHMTSMTTSHMTCMLTTPSPHRCWWWGAEPEKYSSEGEACSEVNCSSALHHDSRLFISFLCIKGRLSPLYAVTCIKSIGHFQKWINAASTCTHRDINSKQEYRSLGSAPTCIFRLYITAFISGI